MIAKVMTLGCEKEYGEPTVVVEDDEIGDVVVREMEIGSLDELSTIAQDVNTIEVSHCSWAKYDLDITFVCEDSSII
jgi:hypothetical protein